MVALLAPNTQLASPTQGQPVQHNNFWPPTNAKCFATKIETERERPAKLLVGQISRDWPNDVVVLVSTSPSLGPL